jgi:hypothetical protein
MRAVGKRESLSCDGSDSQRTDPISEGEDTNRPGFFDKSARRVADDNGAHKWSDRSGGARNETRRCGGRMREFFANRFLRNERITAKSKAGEC